MTKRDLKAERRQAVRKTLPDIVERLNLYLKGKQLQELRPILNRIGRNKQLPHWYEGLAKNHVLPNLDGKTVGSVIEMLFVADVEQNVLGRGLATELRINPASGVDVPDLDLGIKSPSENWCTSEPFTHAYERILGSEYDVVALITNYQDAKKSPPLRLKIILNRYLFASEVADKGLCAKAKKLRDAIDKIGETPAQKALRFLAYANQADWMCKVLLRGFEFLGDPTAIRELVEGARVRFEKDAKKSRRELNPEYPRKLQALLASKPIEQALINAGDEWVIESWRNTAQMPPHSDWERFQRSPLNGQLGVSFALQWRYNFGILFRGASGAEDDDEAGPFD